jgi:hypothetical protein
MWYILSSVSRRYLIRAFDTVYSQFNMNISSSAEKSSTPGLDAQTQIAEDFTGCVSDSKSEWRICASYA